MVVVSSIAKRKSASSPTMTKCETIPFKILAHGLMVWRWGQESHEAFTNDYVVLRGKNLGLKELKPMNTT